MARTWSTSKNLRPYFAAQIAAWLALEIPQHLRLFAKDDPYYGQAWIILTLVVLVAGAVAIWRESAEERWAVILVTPIFPACLALLAYGLLDLDFATRISSATGVVEIWLGISALVIARSRTLKTLGWLWLMQASYQVAFTLRFDAATETWKDLNNYLPMLIVIIAFWKIAVTQERHDPLRAR